MSADGLLTIQGLTPGDYHLVDRSTGQHVVITFGPALWSRLHPGAAPADLQEFATIDGGGRVARSTQRDLWLWIQGPRHDENLRLALSLDRRLGTLGALELDLPAFIYLQSRDLTGFEDGTANPKGDDRQRAALIPEGRPGAGGSIVLTQRWVHDLESFLALAESEQDKAYRLSVEIDTGTGSGLEYESVKDEYEGHLNKGQSLERAAWALVGTAGAMLVTSVVLFAVHGKRTRETAAGTPRPTARVGPTGLEVRF